MKLFTKPGCQKCDFVKGFISPQQTVTTYDISQPEGLAELAFHGLVRTAEKELPILVSREGDVVTGAIPIKQKLTAY
jgi:hypothetical protein